MPRYDEEENDTEDNDGDEEDDDEEDDDNDENNDNADDVAHLGQCGSKQHCQDELWDQRRREASTPFIWRVLKTSWELKLAHNLQRNIQNDNFWWWALI